MKLNHINLTVTDVPGTVKFLEKYFGLQSQGGDNQFAVLFDFECFLIKRDPWSDSRLLFVNPSPDSPTIRGCR
jgi:hypothetical protein